MWVLHYSHGTTAEITGRCVVWYSSTNPLPLSPSQPRSQLAALESERWCGSEALMDQLTPFSRLIADSHSVRRQSATDGEKGGVVSPPGTGETRQWWYRSSRTRRCPPAACPTPDSRCSPAVCQNLPAVRQTMSTARWPAVRQTMSTARCPAACQKQSDL